MDGQLRSRIDAMAKELACQHQQELAAAGTLVDLEELTCQIGDEIARQLCESEVVRRSRQAGEREQVECPDCGERCPRGEPEPVVLEGLRGEVTYNQPSYFCRRCRRSFFPAGRIAGSIVSKHGHPAGVAEVSLGGQQPEQLSDGPGSDA